MEAIKKKETRLVKDHVDDSESDDEEHFYSDLGELFSTYDEIPSLKRKCREMLDVEVSKPPGTSLKSILVEIFETLDSPQWQQQVFSELKDCNGTGNIGLGPAQQIAVTMAMAGCTNKEIALLTGRYESTVYRWFKPGSKPREVMRIMQTNLYDATMNSLFSLQLSAFRRLKELIQSDDQAIALKAIEFFIEKASPSRPHDPFFGFLELLPLNSDQYMQLLLNSDFNSEGSCPEILRKRRDIESERKHRIFESFRNLEYSGEHRPEPFCPDDLSFKDFKALLDERCVEYEEFQDGLEISDKYYEHLATVYLEKAKSRSYLLLNRCKTNEEALEAFYKMLENIPPEEEYLVDDYFHIPAGVAVKDLVEFFALSQQSGRSGIDENGEQKE